MVLQVNLGARLHEHQATQSTERGGMAVVLHTRAFQALIFRGQCSDWLWAGRLRGWNSSPGRGKIFLSPCRPDRFWGPTKPPIQWGRGVKLTSHLHLMSRSRMV
jgi:hypothetical protein